jgi:hypothetical protein
MNLLVFSKVGTIQQATGRGEIFALAVPARDRVTLYRDLDGKSGGEIATRYGMPGKAILWRANRGLVTVYGPVPDEITQRRQAVKVYLPEDLVGDDDTSFFFLINPQWVVHGNRATDDEGHVSWRTTTLRVRDKQSAARLISAGVADQLLVGNNAKIVVAVHTAAEALLPEVAASVQPLGVTPLKLTALKANLGGKYKPLYKHGDFAVVLVALILVAALIFLGMGLRWVLNRTELAQLDGQMESVRNQISTIQLNKNLGHIRNPQGVLDAMAVAIKQQPSAILDSAGQLAAKFGELGRLEVQLTPDQNGAAPAAGGPEPTTMDVVATLDKSVDKLLVDQEQRAKLELDNRPWVRMIENTGSAEQPILRMNVQLTEPEPGSQPPPLPTPVPAPAPAVQQARVLSKTAVVSGTVSPSSVVSLSVTPSPSTAAVSPTPATPEAQP